MKKINKPWGWEEILEENSVYTLKRLFMKKNNRCSLQLHKYKKETIYVIQGILTIQLGNEEVEYSFNDFITINCNTVHRMSALNGDVIYLESSTTHPNDIVRVEDDYGRL